MLGCEFLMLQYDSGFSAEVRIDQSDTCDVYEHLQYDSGLSAEVSLCSFAYKYGLLVLQCDSGEKAEVSAHQSVSIFNGGFPSM
jgi:hypothetical protein